MKQKIVVLTNDAGASEYIAHLILSEQKSARWNILALSNSPASKVFSTLNINYTTINDLAELDNICAEIKPDIIFYGTGWQIDFSEKVEQITQKSKIKSVALIDHWTNYKQRFKQGCTPKNIIVMDSKAKQIALNVFSKNINILQLKNHFLQNTKNEFAHLKNKEQNMLVFISEPTSIIAKNNFGDENAYGFTEYSVVDDIAKKFDNIIIRLHPSDDENKYNDLISKYKTKNIQIIKPYDESLIQTLSKSSLSIGFDGMALYISYILGIRSISYMPNSERELYIPIPLKYKVDILEDIDKLDFDTIDLKNTDQNTLSLEKGLLSIV